MESLDAIGMLCRAHARCRDGPNPSRRGSRSPHPGPFGCNPPPLLCLRKLSESLLPFRDAWLMLVPPSDCLQSSWTSRSGAPGRHCLMFLTSRERRQNLISSTCLARLACRSTDRTPGMFQRKCGSCPGQVCRSLRTLRGARWPRQVADLLC